MKGKMKIATCTLLLPAFFVGCTDSQTTKAQGAGLGALVGAVGGAALGYAIDGSDGAARGALIGAGAGAIGGYAYGNHVANKKAKYASQEDYLDACIAAASNMNNQVASYNQSLANDIAKLKQQNAALASSGAQKSQKLAHKQAIASKRQQANKNLARVTDEIRIQSTVLQNERKASQARISQLNAQIANLKKQKASLQGMSNQLASMESRIAV